MAAGRDSTEGRWPAKRKAGSVLRVLSGEAINDVADDIRVDALSLGQWRDDFIASGTEGLESQEELQSEDWVRARMSFAIEEYRSIRTDIAVMYETAHRVLQWTAGGAIAAAIGALVLFREPNSGLVGAMQLSVVAGFFVLILLSLIAWTTEIYRAARAMVFLRSRERALWSRRDARKLQVEEEAIRDVVRYPLLLSNYLAFGPMALSRAERLANYGLPAGLYIGTFFANTVLFSAVLWNHEFRVSVFSDVLLKGLWWAYLGMMWLLLVTVVLWVLRRSYRMSRQVYGDSKGASESH